MSTQVAELTIRQSEMLEFIRAFIDTHCYSPSIREIMAGMNFKSPNATLGHLKTLERKGFIRRDKGISRSIVVLK